MGALNYSAIGISITTHKVSFDWNLPMSESQETQSIDNRIINYFNELGTRLSKHICAAILVENSCHDLRAFENRDSETIIAECPVNECLMYVIDAAHRTLGKRLEQIIRGQFNICTNVIDKNLQDAARSLEEVIASIDNADTVGMEQEIRRHLEWIQVTSDHGVYLTNHIKTKCSKAIDYGWKSNHGRVEQATNGGLFGGRYAQQVVIAERCLLDHIFEVVNNETQNTINRLKQMIDTHYAAVESRLPRQ